MTVWPNGLSTMPTLTSPYGPRDIGFHNGADFIGFPTVRAVEAGVVKYAGWNALMGNIVYASHAGDTYRTRSCHMAYTPTVRTGQTFHQGDMFGAPGNTGSESRGVHLHFDVYLLGPNGWYRTDPVAFLNKRMGTTAGGNSTPFPTDPDDDEEADMAMKGAAYTRGSDNARVFLLFNEASGFWQEHTGVPGEYNNALAQNWGTGSWPTITEAHARVIKNSCDKVRAGSLSVSGALNVSGLEATVDIDPGELAKAVNDDAAERMRS